MPKIHFSIMCEKMNPELGNRVAKNQKSNINFVVIQK